MHFLLITQFYGSIFVKMRMRFSQRFEHTILFISCLKHGNPAVDKGKSWCLIKGALSGLRKILATESSTERSNFPTNAS